MIVITLTKVPNSLRGDLTKWCQEIQTGVYVGSFSARIREMLWSRILKNIGTGEATLVYSTNNELGYTFRTTRRDKRVVDFDGVPLMMQMIETPPIRHGFSKAAKYHKSKKFSKKTNISNNMIKGAIKNDFIAVDLETTGLNTSRSKIISIGAIKENLKGVKTTLGVSNVSFGLSPDSRQILNSVFLSEAVKAGQQIQGHHHEYPAARFPAPAKAVPYTEWYMFHFPCGMASM